MAKFPTITIAEAKQLAADWEAQYDQHQRDAAIGARFKDATPRQVIQMWESGKNEADRKLTHFEFCALMERWCELFSALSPDDDAAIPELDPSTEPSVPAPDDDTMLR